MKATEILKELKKIKTNTIKVLKEKKPKVIKEKKIKVPKEKKIKVPKEKKPPKIIIKGSQEHINVLEAKKRYYYANKERINNYMMKKVPCPQCEILISRCNMSVHNKRKHIIEPPKDNILG